MMTDTKPLIDYPETIVEPTPTVEETVDNSEATVTTLFAASKPKTALEAVTDHTPTKRKRRKKNFVNNADMLAEIIKSQEQGKMTENLGKMFIIMCNRYKRSSRGDFSKYSYFEDMVSHALENLVKNVWIKFDATKYTNAFAFVTSAIHNSFIQVLNKEKKQRDIRDKIMVENGLDASWRYNEEHSSGRSTDGDYSSETIEDTNKEDTELVS